MFALFLSVLLVLGKVVKSRMEQIKAKFYAIKNKMVWNGIINSLNFSYLGICISISASFQSTDKNALVIMVIVNILIILILFAIPVVMAVHSMKNYRKFRKN